MSKGGGALARCRRHKIITERLTHSLAAVCADDGNMHRLMDTHELFIHSGVMQPARQQHHKLISRQPLLLLPDELQNKLCPASHTKRPDTLQPRAC
jgi:hypothetical protein